jgi:hypothetical protein
MSDTDSNTEARRTVTDATVQHEQPLPAELEAAWAEWSRGVQKVDERGMALLRAAFEAGWGGGESSASVNMGRAGGLKGGRARASQLSADRRSEIAKKAAATRWAKGTKDE